MAPLSVPAVGAVVMEALPCRHAEVFCFDFQ